MGKAESEERAAEDEHAPYTVKQAAKKANVNIKTLYEGVRKGDVPHFRVNKVIRIPRPAFDELLRQGKIA
jgi:excisionase family DNA binding protein